jgi:hypothetical protein
MSNNPTAGKGTPYWYEWSVGLLRVVDMLYQDSGIASVSFQETGTKGWDDVVVRLKNGKIEFIQVKHTREGNNLTFGSFVGVEENADSLLKSLYDAWVAMGHSATMACCRVFTNREAGERKYKNRPPLLSFFSWVKAEAKLRSSIADFQPPEEFKDAWREWLEQMKSGTDETRLDFLRALEIETNQPDLEGLQNEICSRLAKALGISTEKAAPLLQALNSALRRWTHDHERVSPEDVVEALALPDEIDVLKSAPAPPFPFFVSRERNASELEQSLLQPEGLPVIFLSAAPGAGKTSLMSRLEMRRSEEAFGGVIDLRYFAFRPITPEQYTTPSDSDFYVDPKELWYSLLSQLRRKLKGKLAAHEVPVRNELLSWSEARRHVLRLADRLGKELGRKFVIAIDGIDHAARAGRLRYEPGKAEDFFRSLPGPEELSNMQVRLLIAGQPAANYQEYPSWLKQPHADVKVASLDPLTRNDIAALVRSKGIALAPQDWDECVAIIADETQGNTLAVVFAVAEASTCTSLEEFRQRLKDRKLQDGLEAYYSSIWRYALAVVADSGESRAGVKEALAGTLCLLREPVNGTLLESTFPKLGLSADQWTLVLRRLGPLVVAAGTGFQVIHNDLRVFLARQVSERSQEDLAWVASCLADYYTTSTSGRETAHATLRRLLEIAGRGREWAKFFNVRWVFEAAALGQPFEDVAEEGKAALLSAIELQDWEALHEVACAIESLERWENNRHDIPKEERAAGLLASPFFPLSEIHVTPSCDWTTQEFQRVTMDVRRILDVGENDRAKGLLHRWFSELNLNQLAERFYCSGGDKNRDENHNYSTDGLFESLGNSCRQSGYSINHESPANDLQNRGIFYFERGWVERSCTSGPFESLASCFDRSVPRYFRNRELGIQILSKSGKWRLVGRLLRCSHSNRAKFSDEFRRFATWWCVRTGIDKRCPGWLEPLEDSSYGPRDTSTGNIDELLALSKARGWLAPAQDISTVTDSIYSRSTFSKVNRVGMKVPIRAAVMLGQASSLLARGKTDNLRDLIPPLQLKQLIEAIWSGKWKGKYDSAAIAFSAGDLAVELVETFFELGENYETVLVEAALPIAAKAPGDYRAESAWLALKKAGKLSVLREWGEKVLGEDGWLWTEEYSSRVSSGDEFIDRVSEIGESDLVNATRRKLKWQRIGYRGNEDHSFRWPYRWFSELAMKSALPVMDQVYRLLSLAEACKAQGGDNRWSGEISEALGAAAIAAGPDDLWRLIFSTRSDRGDRRWLSRTKKMVVGGYKTHLSIPSPLDEDAKVALWCLSIGLSRWFDNGDVASIAGIRKSLLDTASGDNGVDRLRDLLLRISLGEGVREPWKKDDDDDEPEESPVEDLDWKSAFEAGKRLDPAKAAAAVRELNRRNESDREQKLTQVLEQFGINDSLFGAWSRSEELEGALKEIVGAVPDSLLWSVAKAALLKVEEGGYWYSSAFENLNGLLLARASSKGAAELKAGLDRLLLMHEQWARGGDMSLSINQVQPADGPFVPNWEELAARSLTGLLSSRWGVVLESVLVGTNALASWRPSTIPSLLAGCTEDDWRRRWLLSLLEVWAAERPEDVSPLEAQLEQLGRSSSLSTRLQLWIVRRLLAKSRGDEMPSFPFAESSAEESGLHKVGGILETPADIRGSFQYVDTYNSAQSRLHRIESAAGLDLSDIESRVGSGLLALEKPPESAKHWLESIKNDPDFQCQGEPGRITVDRALDCVLGAGIHDRSFLLRFAQGALDSDEGWILRNSPLPFPDMSKWPSESFLEGRHSDPPTDSEVRELLREVARNEAISEDEVVLAASFRAYSWREDFSYYSWFAESDEPADAFRQVPSTISGRTFPWMLGDGWWEPERPEGSCTIAFKVGGLQQLLMSSPEVVPSRLWVEAFGWNPSPTNPFKWTCKGEAVARLEVYHGPALNHSRNAGRHALLHRWIAKKEAFVAATASLPRLKPYQQFSRQPFLDD